MNSREIAGCLELFENPSGTGGTWIDELEARKELRKRQGGRLCGWRELVELAQGLVDVAAVHPREPGSDRRAGFLESGGHPGGGFICGLPQGVLSLDGQVLDRTSVSEQIARGQKIGELSDGR